jgi:hypothetical protein
MQLSRSAVALVLLGVVSCKGKEGDTGSEREVELGAPAAQLVLPDLSDVDEQAAILEAMDIALSIRGANIWAGHERAFERRFEGCPDVYVGAPEDSDLDEDDAERGEGMSWSDFCESAGGLYFRGWHHWISAVSTTGDVNDSAGQTQEAGRRLSGNAVIGDADDIRYEFEGEVSDSVYVVQAGDYRRETWSSQLTGSAHGTDLFALASSPTPSGYRADLYVAVQTGDVQRFEARGDIYLYEDRIQDRFDSVSMSLEFIGELGAGPEDCTAEPRGWIGLRDENAWWLDVVFQPAGDDDATDAYEDPDYSPCDGCGTAYLRGIEQTVELGEICLDLSAVWSAEGLAAPDPSSYISQLRDLSDSLE